VIDEALFDAEEKMEKAVAVARDDLHGLRDGIRGQSFPAWSTTAYSEGKRYVWAVHTGTIVAPLARFAADSIRWQRPNSWWGVRDVSSCTTRLR